MCLSMLPAWALAEEGTLTEPEEETEEIQIAEESVESAADPMAEPAEEESTGETVVPADDNAGTAPDEPEIINSDASAEPDDVIDETAVLPEPDAGEDAEATEAFDQDEDNDGLDDGSAAEITETVDADPVLEEELILEPADIIVSGSCGSLTWTLDDAGILTISGTGSIPDYSINDNYAPWYNRRSEIFRVVLEPGVTSIGEYAFYECSSLTDVTLPETLTLIDDNAFDSCSSLPGLTLPNGLQRIGTWAFWECTSLTSITIPASVTGIGGQAFLECTALTSITVDPENTYCASQDGVLFNKEKTVLRWYPAGRPDKTYTIPDGVTSISDDAFSYCRFLTHVVFPESVSFLGNNVFENAISLQEITLPSRMSTIYPNVFEGCTALKSVTIPEGITEIRSHTFRNCSSLETVIFPSTVNNIDADELFYNCTSLKSIEVHPDNAVFCSQDGVLFNKAKTALIQYPVGKTETVYNIPKGVTSIQTRAFEKCAAIEKIKIPNGVTWIPRNTFNFCTSLTTVIIPVSVTNIGEAAFNGCSSITDVYYGGGASEWKKISIGVYNSYLTRASIEYGYEDPEDEEISNTASIYSDYFSFRHDSDSNHSAWCYYNDSFFDASSWSYNHDLARMSMSLAMSAFTKGGTQGFNEHVDVSEYSRNELLELPPGNVVELMQNCGFTKIAVNEDYLLTIDYGPVNDGNNIGVCIGAKTLEEEDTYLIAVAVRGGGYGCEWIGDFNAYNPNHYSYHIGFEIAASEVISQLRDYISENSIVGKLKIWICGYSRGAATANLAAAKVADGALNGLGCTLNSTDLFGYMFETPQGTKNPNAKASQYNGIWNVINPIDAVTYVAMDDWGYTRYGHDMKLPSQYLIAKLYDAYYYEVLGKFNEYKGSSYSSIPHMRNQYWEVIKLKNALPQILGDDGSYLTSVFMGHLQNWFKGGTAKALEFADVFSKALKLFVEDPALFAAGGAVIAGYAVLYSAWDVAAAHFPELNLAWLNSIESSTVMEDGFIKFAVSNCPVDLAVYADGVLQMCFTGDEVIYEGGAYIEGSIDADGQKVVCIPEDTDVRIEIAATEDGEFNYSVQTYDIQSDQVTEVVNYYDVLIGEGDSLRAEVNNSTTGQVLLYGEDGGLIPADEELTGGGIVGYTVSVTADGDGTATGGGYYTTGEFAQVTATANEGAVFQGWYHGDALLSQQTVYRFRPTENTSLTARFQSGTSAADFGLSETEIAISSGESYQLTMINAETGTPAAPSGTVTWTSSNRDVVRVNSNGTVTAVAVGAATIHVQSENGDLNADCRVNVLFEDVADSSAYYYHPVYWAAGKGVTSGTSPTTFSPGRDCTRGQIVTFLWKAMGSPEPNSAENPFTDVKEGDYFYKPVLWAKENGITSGTSATTFSPGKPCTRGQIVTFLWIAKGRPEPVLTENPFTDVKTEDYFFKPVLWAKENGITSGTSDTTFSPSRTCTRAQAMTFLWIASGRP